MKVRAYNSYGAGDWSDRLGVATARISTLPSDAPVFGDGPETSIHVYENHIAGTAFWTPFTATDTTTPAQTLTYKLGGTDAASFSLDTATGQLSLASGVTLDAATKDSYSIYILASDDGNFGNDYDTDNSDRDNDNAALWVTVEVRECGGVWCGTMTAGDLLQGSRGYTAWHGDGEVLPSTSFTIDGNTNSLQGLVYESSPPELVGFYPASGTASDFLDGYALKIDSHVFVFTEATWDSVNERWTWTSLPSGFDISVGTDYELSLVLLPLGKTGTPELVAATQNSMLVKWMPPSSLGAGLDTATANQGWEVRVCRSTSATCYATGTANWWSLTQTPVTGPDSDGYYSTSITGDHFNTGPQHLVKVRARGTGGDGEWSDRLGGTGTRISTLPSDAPVFDAGPETTIVVYDYHSAGTAIGTFTATDTTSPAETLTYKLGGTDADSFTLDTATGQLSLASGVTLDAATKDSYSIYILASDDGNFGNDYDTDNSTADNDNAYVLVDVEVRECGGIWCATMTAGDSGQGATGYAVLLGFGEVVPGTSFTVDGSTNTLYGLLYWPSPNRELQFYPVSGTASDFLDGYALKIDSHVFVFTDATWDGTEGRWRWFSPPSGFSISAGTDYELSLVQLPPGKPELVGGTQNSMLVKWLPPTGMDMTTLDTTQGNQGWDLRFCKHGSGCDAGSSTTNWSNLTQEDVTGPDSDGYYSASVTGAAFTDQRQHLVKVRAYSSSGAGEFSERLGASSTGGTVSTLPDDAPVFGDGQTTTIFVNDSHSPGTAVKTFTATDSTSPAETLTYKLGGTDAGSFTLDTSTGQLSLASGVTLDAATKDSYSIYILASDDGNFTNDYTELDSATTADNDNAALWVDVKVCGDIWCATLVAKEFSLGPTVYHGYDKGVSGDATLAPATFTHDGTSYEVVDVSQHSTTHRLYFETSPSPADPKTLWSGFSLVIGTTTFAIDDAGVLATGSLEWNPGGAVISANQTYTVGWGPPHRTRRRRPRSRRATARSRRRGRSRPTAARRSPPTTCATFSPAGTTPSTPTGR